jgi:hypothetical protein
MNLCIFFMLGDQPNILKWRAIKQLTVAFFAAHKSGQLLSYLLLPFTFYF